MMGRPRKVDAEARDRAILEGRAAGLTGRAAAARAGVPLTFYYARLAVLRGQSRPVQAVSAERLAYGPEPLPANCALARRIFAGVAA